MELQYPNYMLVVEEDVEPDERPGHAGQAGQGGQHGRHLSLARIEIFYLSTICNDKFLNERTTQIYMFGGYSLFMTSA